MLEAEAKRKICPIMSDASTRVKCEGSDCVFWAVDDAGPKSVPATDRQKWQNDGWSTNNEIDEAGNVVIYREPAGHCAAA